MKIYTLFWKKKKRNKSCSEELIHGTRVSITKNRTNIKAFFFPPVHPAYLLSIIRQHLASAKSGRALLKSLPRGDTSCQLSRPETEYVHRTTDGPLSVSWTSTSQAQENVSRTLSSFARFSVFTAKWHLRERLFDVESCPFLFFLSLSLFRISFPWRKYRRWAGVKEHLCRKHIRSFTVFIDGERNSRSGGSTPWNRFTFFLDREDSEMVGCYL